jgi:hypothetical protein
MSEGRFQTVSDLYRDGGDPNLLQFTTIYKSLYKALGYNFLIKKLDSWLKTKGINEIAIKGKKQQLSF